MCPQFDSLHWVAAGTSLGYLSARYLVAYPVTGTEIIQGRLLCAGLLVLMSALSLVCCLRGISCASCVRRALILGLSVLIGGMADAPARQILAYQTLLNDPAATRLLVEGTVAETGPGWAHLSEASGSMLLRFPGNLAAQRLHPGDAILVLGAPISMHHARNPGSFDAVTWMLGKGFSTAMEVRRIHIRHAHRKTSFLDRLQMRSMARIEQLFPEASVRSLASAMVLGDRSLLDSDTVQGFRDAGLMHLLAVSGLHFGCIVLFTWLVAGSAVRRLNTSVVSQQISLSILVLSCALGYAVMVGWTPSVLRSFLMLTLMLVCRLLGQGGWLTRSLLLSGLIILWVDPLLWRQAGTHLSFSAVAGIALGIRLVRDMRFFATRRRRKGIVMILTPFIVSTAAFMGTLPVLLWHIGWVPWIAVFASPPAVALTSVTLILSITALVLPVGALPVAQAASLGFRSLIWFSENAGSLPFPEIRATDSLDLMAGFTPMMCLLVVATLKRRYLKSLVMIFLIAATSLLTWRLTPPSLTMLDVGQGDALIFEPGEVAFSVQQDTLSLTWVIDTGTGKRTGTSIGMALEASGHEAIQLLLSHADSDHAGGRDVLESIVDIQSLTTAWNDSNPSTERLHTRLRGSRLPLPTGLRGYVLHPGGPGKRNAYSLVTLITIGRTGILLTGDVEALQEYRLIEHYGPLLDRLDFRILKVAHHGSSTSSSPMLLERFKPDVALISAGQNNRFGHPHKDVLERLHARNTTVLQTAVHGAIRLRGFRHDLRVECHKNGRWQRVTTEMSCP
jgi:competence protein ComEC